MYWLPTAVLRMLVGFLFGISVMAFTGYFTDAYPERLRAAGPSGKVHHIRTFTRIEPQISQYRVEVVKPRSKQDQLELPHARFNEVAVGYQPNVDGGLVRGFRIGWPSHHIPGCMYGAY